ncbi:hypothetical protein ACI8AA_02580 [Geodermatophilus sp. SYSU D01180]
MTAEEQWLRNLPLKMRQFSMVFLQLGSAAARLRASITTLKGQHVDVMDLLNERVALSCDLVFIHQFDRLKERRGDELGRFRDLVMREAQNARVFAFLSTAPKTAYPETRGSDIVADAKQIFPTWLFDKAGVNGPSSDGPEFDFLVRCIRELGDRTVVVLSEALWEQQLSPRDVLEWLPRLDVEALRGAGLVSASGDEVSWSLTGSSFRSTRAAVALVASESVSYRTAVPDSFAEMWMLERMIRNAVRSALIGKMGDGWRETCLPEALKADVLDRARRDSQPRARKMADLRDPLEWLSTSELLDLRETRELGPLGMEQHYWSRLRVEILPIRNRLAHMRLIDETDLRRIATWRKIVSEKAIAASGD